jgi:6-pyruvoyltetrahydropterin/6-carboxytetrahydropterin synthase
MRFSVRSSFLATHQIRIDAHGTLEPIHAHNWRVEAFLTATEDHGGVAPEARAFLVRWVSRYDGNCFNDVAPFDEVNPTAEEVARVLAHELAGSVPGAVVEHVEVGEATGFSAIYWPVAK